MPRIMLDWEDITISGIFSGTRLRTNISLELAKKGYRLDGIEGYHIGKDKPQTTIRIRYSIAQKEEKQLDIPLTKAEYDELISGQEEKASSRIVAAIRSSV